MERRVSFDVTDYDPEENVWGSINDTVPISREMSGSLPPINQTSLVNNFDDVTTSTRVKLHKDKVEKQRKELDSVHKHIKHVSECLKPISTTTYTSGNLSKSTAAESLKGLKMFISPIQGGWTAVERRFDMLTAVTSGLLIRSKFGECIGINSKEFVLELLDALARRVRIRGDAIDKDQLYEFWGQINDQNFKSRVMTIIDIACKDGTGRLTRDDIREYISLILSANNKSNFENKADEYAAQIMEEFDPHDIGFISIEELMVLFKEMGTECVTNTEETEKNVMLKQKPLRKWYKVIEAISSSSLNPCSKKRPSTKNKS